MCDEHLKKLGEPVAKKSRVSASLAKLFGSIGSKYKSSKDKTQIDKKEKDKEEKEIKKVIHSL